MQANTLQFVDIFEMDPGVTEVYCSALGVATFVGISKDGDAVLQLEGNEFTTIPEVSWNVMMFVEPFQPETHVKYIKEDDLKKLHDPESFMDISLADKADMLYEYELVMNIRKVYDSYDQ